MCVCAVLRRLINGRQLIFFFLFICDLFPLPNAGGGGYPLGSATPTAGSVASASAAYSLPSHSVYELAALTQDLDTQGMTTKIKEVLLANNIGQKVRHLHFHSHSPPSSHSVLRPAFSSNPFVQTQARTHSSAVSIDQSITGPSRFRVSSSMSESERINRLRRSQMAAGI